MLARRAGMQRTDINADSGVTFHSNQTTRLRRTPLFASLPCADYISRSPRSYRWRPDNKQVGKNGCDFNASTDTGTDNEVQLRNDTAKNISAQNVHLRLLSSNSINAGLCRLWLRAVEVSESRRS